MLSVMDRDELIPEQKTIFGGHKLHPNSKSLKKDLDFFFNVSLQYIIQFANSASLKIAGEEKLRISLAGFHEYPLEFAHAKSQFVLMLIDMAFHECEVEGGSAVHTCPAFGHQQHPSTPTGTPQPSCRCCMWLIAGLTNREK